MRTNLNFLNRAIVIFLIFLISACAPKGRPQPQTPEIPLIWPQEPAKPRIAFVRAFSSPEDLGISKGFFQQIVEFITGSADIHMVRPMAVVVNKDGVIYVADPGSKGVHRFDPVKGRYDLIRMGGGKPLLSPVGLTVATEGEVYITDSLLDQVFVIKPGSKKALPFPLKEKIEQPTGIAFDKMKRYLYIVDTGAHQIKVFGMDGTLYKAFGHRGTGDGEFNYPTLIWIDDNPGRIFVTDSLNFRIQIFDEDGKFIEKFGKLGDATGDMSRPKGVATDRFGHIYVVDSVFHTVQVFNLSGEFLLNFGSQGQGLGEFWLPTGIFIGENETIYVADSHNKRIQVFRYVGGEQ
jgi:DNA-binding beta-propeller fold protein YncE